MKMTRRELAGAIAAGAGATGMGRAHAGQAAAPVDARAQGARIREDRQALAKYQVPISAEPAFSFKA